MHFACESRTFPHEKKVFGSLHSVKSRLNRVRTVWQVTPYDLSA